MSGQQNGYDYENDLEEDVELEEPKRYQIILLNDDYTTMEFVVEILTTIFRKSSNEAMKVMLDVHKNGKGVCGIYPYEIAETKVEQVKMISQKNNFPLRVVLEEE